MTAPTATRRILLVEDDHELRDALTEALTEHGHDVVAVSNGREALARMRVARPDVVILDLMMPVMDGWQFRVEQRRSPELARTPVLAISASRSPTAAAVDADLYLPKPFDVTTLLDAVEDVLLTRQRMQEPAVQAQNERLAALGALAAGLTHEVNNPLTYVLLHLAHALRLLPALTGGRPSREARQLEVLLRGALDGAERIKTLTSSIRTFSRVDDLERTTVDVRAVLDAALELCANELRHRARLTRDYGDTPFVSANEGRLGQVFLNLLTNAIQAIPEGAVHAHEIRVKTGAAGDHASIEIADTGGGIAPHLASRIFEPFFSTKPLGEGTGLGLSISQGIVAALGGEIRVASEVGRGTTFTILLPSAHASARLELLEVRGATPAAPLRVLVIDDEPEVAGAIRDALPEHEVTTAASGRAALARLAEDDGFDVILCDVHMPDLPGPQLLERLRRSYPALAARVVFMTAGAFTDPARALVADLRQAVVDKPLDLDRLRALLARTGPRSS